MLRSTHKDQLFFTVANNQNKTLNIVKMLLENYEYRVVDLDRDVDPHEIVRVAKEQNIRLIGLSALMTTTVKAMEQTIDLLREEIPDAKRSRLNSRIRRNHGCNLVCQGRRRKRSHCRGVLLGK